MGKTIAIVDYGAGNIASIRNALEYLGMESVLAEKARQLREAAGIVFPGQGNFGRAMQYMENAGTKEVLMEEILSGKPYLGICLGMQVLFEGSDESPGRDGLGVFRGRCRRFSVERKIPLIGWAKVMKKPGSKAFAGVVDGSYFYFVNSYFAVPEDKGIVSGTSFYGEEFCSAVGKGNVVGLQFHPENSGKNGI